MKSFDFPYVNDSPLDLSGSEGAPLRLSIEDNGKNDFTGDVTSTITISRVEYDSLITLQAENQTLRAALVAAQEHLEYCGYADSWERECAEAAKLPQQIDAALKPSKN